MKTLLLILITTTLTSCGQTTKNINSDKNPMTVTQMDTATIAIIPFENTSNWTLFKNCKPSNLTNTDITEIEQILIKCIDNYNTEPEQKKGNIDNTINLASYKRQYVPVINEKEEKEVWINCFCNDWDRDWKKGIIQVLDGGKCYFNLKINLTTKTYYDLIVNGDG